MSGMSDWLEAIALIIGVVIWLVRLEGKINYVEKYSVETQKDVDELRARHELLDSKIVEQLSKIRESLARLEGRVGVKEE